MRAALVTALLVGLPVVAAADAPRAYPKLGVWKNTVKKLPDGVKPLTSVSHVLYLNDCRPNGCTVSPGGDDSRSDRSSIPVNTVVLSPFSYGDDYWNRLVQCVKETYAPFDVQIVTQDPGTAEHFEVMIGGRATQLHPDLQGAGGVAPFIDCSTSSNNVISFVFSDEVNDLEFLCGAVAQEATHVWGLDHVLDADDPMTYLELGSLKRFQNRDRDCGEDLSNPRQCFCGGSQQNSVRFFNNAFGPAMLTPASLSIVSPVEGQWVKPGFPVHAELDSQLSVATAALAIDGSQTSSIDTDPLAFNAPTTLPGGDHTVTVTATDQGNRTVTDSVTVHVTAACSASAPCAADFHCLGGYCLPGANEAGGLGATCSTNDQCITGQCASDGTESLCAGACDAGNVCPAGFVCLQSGGANGTCWPGEPDDGGCQTGNGGSGFAFAGLALLGFAFVTRRRR
ncbi:MAG TPA: MYXO-CTERM sorting domain-containing protein [Kofleriaceae bacterium]|nr:MYXO-CTERM sorting domain-containing protein [Kofleriaceae bacterium]